MKFYVNRDLDFDEGEPPIQGATRDTFIALTVIESNIATRRPRDPVIEKTEEELLDCWAVEVKDLHHLLTLIEGQGAATLERGVYKNHPGDWDITFWGDS